MTQTTIQLRRGTAVQWVLANTVLAPGELGLETDSQRFKFGDGVTPWVSLGYGAAPANVLIPSNATPPSISGLAAVGNVLTANPGTWTQSPTTFSYQWFQDTPTGAVLLEATGPTYTAQASDVGFGIYVQVAASNQYGSGAAVASADTALVTAAASPVPANTAAPSISGTPQAGQTLTASTGTWSNSPTSYAYQWFSGSVIQNGATASTYALTGADVGNTITVQATATNANGSSAPVSSGATAAVTSAAAAVPANTVAPSISGTAQVGQTLTVSNGTWTNSPTSYAYQWKWVTTPGVAGTPIAGATASTYSPQASDVGHTLYCAVTATNNGGSGYGYATATASVAAAGGGGGGGAVVWDGTFASGTIPASTYPSQSVVAGHVTVVPDPVGGVVKVAKFAITNSDAPYSGASPRGDLLGQPVLTEGSVLYISIPIRIQLTDSNGATLPVYAGNASSFYQWAEVKDNIGGNPNWGLGLINVGGVNRFHFGCHAPYAGTQFSAPLDGNWHCAILGGLWTRFNTGWMKMWWDSNPVTFAAGGQTLTNWPTMGAYNPTSTNAQPLDINSYRSFNTPSATVTSWHGPPKIGTTFASVVPTSGPTGP